MIPGKKAIKAKDKVINSMSKADQKHYAVYVYMKKNCCQLSEAYRAVYKCSAATASASASRLAATESWQTLTARMEEAALHTQDTIKTEITAAMLDILHDKKAAPGDKTKAAQVLARTFDLESQNLNISVDPVTQYAQACLEAAAAAPIISPKQLGPIVDIDADAD